MLLIRTRCHGDHSTPCLLTRLSLYWQHQQRGEMWSSSSSIFSDLTQLHHSCHQRGGGVSSQELQSFCSMLLSWGHTWVLRSLYMVQVYSMDRVLLSMYVAPDNCTIILAAIFTSKLSNIKWHRGGINLVMQLCDSELSGTNNKGNDWINIHLVSSLNTHLTV